MAEKTTFIKIDRNITEWRWFKDSKVYHVFSWLLIKANVKKHDFQKQTINRGSLVTSYESIADACGLSVSSVRRVIKDLEDTGEIERDVKNHYQIIKIVKYDEYQGCSERTDKQQSSEQPVEQPVEQANGNNIRIYKNDNNGEEWKEEYASQEYPCGTAEKPEWMDDVLWDDLKYRTVENIPGLEQGFYDSYIEYAKECHEQGRDIK